MASENYRCKVETNVEVSVKGLRDVFSAEFQCKDTEHSPDYKINLSVYIKLTTNSVCITVSPAC